jgi:Uncharacterised protein family (UPF0137)
VAKWMSRVLGRRSRPEEDPEEEAVAPSATGTMALQSHWDSQTEAQERQLLRGLLEQYAPGENERIDQDLSSLINLTKEVRAINNQAALLHGERIKKAQVILKNYKEGAFTAWLKSTYGNRQTPYNLLQYYEFVMSMPRELRSQVEQMPRQAVYTLASRSGEMEKKLDIVQKFSGQTKNELLTEIRDAFPLPEGDRRRQDIASGSTQMLKKVHHLLHRGQTDMTESQRESIYQWLEQIRTLLDDSPLAEM